MKIKLIESYYNQETGISYAKINTDYGEFEGYAKLHEEDKEIASKYAGCQYAETRAVLKYMRNRIKILTYQIKALINYQKQIKCRMDYNPHTIENKVLKKQIYILRAEKADWQSRYDSLHSKLHFAITNRQKVVEKMIADSKKGD